MYLLSYYYRLVFLFLGVLSAVTLAYSQPAVPTKVLSSEVGMEISLEFPAPDYQVVKTPLGEFIRIDVPGLLSGGEKGYPELPVYQSLLELPGGNSTWHLSWEIISTTDNNLQVNFPGRSVVPYQGPLCKHPDSAQVFHYAAAGYQVPTRSQDLVVIEDLGMMRTRRLGRLVVRPFIYDPLSGAIRMVSSVKVSIAFIADNTATQDTYRKSPMFSLPSGMLLGGGMKSSARDNLSRYPITMVIVSPPMFADSLQGFIAWKEKKGFNVIEAYTDNPQVGTTTTSIRNYLMGLYQNATAAQPAPTYLLIVGDVAQIPAFSGTTGSHVTDLYYAEYTGDNLPELYYGRFSANNLDELMPQIRKTLMYEKYQIPDPTYLDHVVMIGGVDSYYGPTHANGQINYGTSNYFNAAHGLTSHTYLYPASGSSDAQIRLDVSNGVAYANYTAHGGTGGWSDPTFNTTHVPLMTNAGKYPLMVGNACLTNSFQIASCFGEALLRASNKGALGYIGASNNTYWNEDFWWGVGLGTVSATPSYAATGLGAYDRLWHDHGEPYADWYVTQGQMIHAGNLAVEASTSSLKKYYWEVYHLMGDPSLMVYFSQPPTMPVSLPSLVQPAAASVNVQTVPYALVALSRGAILHGSALADGSGLAVVEIAPFQSPGSADIVVTAQNYQPYFGSFMVSAPAGPYPVVDQVLVNDAAANANGAADAGESLYLAAVVSNAGSLTADTVMILINSTDTFLTLYDSVIVVTNLGAGQSDTLWLAFGASVSPEAPDQHTVMLSFEACTSTDTLNYTRSVILNAPVMVMDGYAAYQTGGSGLPDPGENVAIDLFLRNEGHSEAANLQVLLTPITPFLVAADTQQSLPVLLPSNSDTLIIPAYIASSCPQGYTLSALAEVYAGSRLLMRDTVSFQAGRAPVAVIDFDGNGSSAPAIIAAVQADGYGVEVFYALPANLSPYSAVFVCLGIYSENYQLTTAEGQALAAYLTAGGSLYMEGGDTWYYDPKTAVHNMFNINGTADGSADLATLSGTSGSFTSGMSFVYSGEENWIDRLAPVGNAFSIFQNSNPSYVAAIANDAGTYRTIGSSFEFSGLSNGASPSTRNELMAEYLDFFGLPGQDLQPGFLPGSVTICVGDTVPFTDTTSSLPVGWFWSFPGGSPSWSVDQHPMVFYDQPGTYEVSMYVTDGGNVHLAPQQTVITVLPRPQVMLHPLDIQAVVNDTVHFLASGADYSACVWEHSTDNGSSWTQLSDDNVHSGTGTGQLSIIIPDTSFNGRMYRWKLDGSCPVETFSQAAELDVDPLPDACTGISGFTYYDNLDSSALPGAKIFVDAQSIASDTSGPDAWFCIPLSSQGDYQVRAEYEGYWGGVNSTDALLMMRHFVGMTNLSGLALSAADVDGSTHVNATDALIASKRFVGMLSAFPAGDWISEQQSVWYPGSGDHRQDIRLLCRGDVDRSYAPLLKQQPQNESLGFPGRGIAGDKIEIRIGLDSDMPPGAVSAVFNWPGHWALQSVREPANGQFSCNIIENQLLVSWFSLTPWVLSADQPWLVLNVTGIRTGDPLVLANPEIADATGNVMKNAALRLLSGPGVEQRITVGEPYPQPAKDRIWWEVSVPDEGRARVSLYELSGRFLSDNEFKLSSGNHSLNIGTPFNAGLFLLQLEIWSGDEQFNLWKRVVVKP